MDIIIQNVKKDVKKEFQMPGDKSITHRSLIIGALARGKFVIENFPNNLDCIATAKAMENIGVTIVYKRNTLIVNSPGYKNFNKNVLPINSMNSGTTVRLISGLIAGCDINTSIFGDESLSKRPMDRIINPLLQMGAHISCENGTLPIKCFESGKLNGISYYMPVSSAQVKSCILIAGYLGNGETTVYEKDETRDHTENIFKYMGVPVYIEKNSIKIRNHTITSRDFIIPGDISSAAYLIALAVLMDNTYIKFNKVLLNDGRIEFLKVLKEMGADINWKEEEFQCGEKVGSIEVYSSKLCGIKISKHRIANIIDEIPVLSVLAAFSSGTTVFESVDELKYKESNRLNAIVENFKTCDLKCDYKDKNLYIFGDDKYIDKNININSFKDHRIALSFLVLSSRNKGTTAIKDYQCVDISFPNSLNYFSKFFSIIQNK
ncbi:MAG: aroA2 [Clostridiaceae bacterium]|nr:aroA2 [Clostridiaceae bacterium]